MSILRTATLAVSISLLGLVVHVPRAHGAGAADDMWIEISESEIAPFLVDPVFADDFDAGACIAPAGLTRAFSGPVFHANGTPRQENVTAFENIWGWQSVGPRKVWPGIKGLLQRPMLPRDSYISLKFTVPESMVQNNYGMYRFDETQPQSMVSMTISYKCGDFRLPANNPISPSCAVDNMFAGGAGATALYWKLPGSGFPTSIACPLQPGQTYYLNMINASLTNPLSSHCVAPCGNLISNDGTGVWP